MLTFPWLGETGVNGQILNKSTILGPIYKQKIILHCLYETIAILPKKQTRRIYVRFFLGMNNADIAATEGVSHAAGGDGVSRGLKMIEKCLKELRVWEKECFAFCMPDVERRLVKFLT